MRLIRTLASFAAVSAIASTAGAQPAADETPAQNTIYAEGLGAGLLYSINYERRVIDELGIRAGFGYTSFSASAGTASSKSTWLTVPITVSYLGLHSKKATFEAGGGTTLSYWSGAASSGLSRAEGSGLTPYVVAFVGYRLHPVKAGFNFRIGAMAIGGKGVSFSGDKPPNEFGFIPWGYISLGGSF